MAPSAFDQEDDGFTPSSGIRARPLGGTGRKTIVIVGHGMVGQRMCEEIRSHRALARHKVVVFGEEPTFAYDRVHLCDVFRGKPLESLQLMHKSWFEEKRVTVLRGDPVTEILRDEMRVRTHSGRVQPYHHLVLATGATPFLAKIPGIDGPRVRALRTTEDAKFILSRANEARERDLPIVIIGGGLLGIELGHELLTLGAAVEILESADYPLSRQLEKSAGRLLHTTLRKAGLSIRTAVRVTEIRSEGEQTWVAFNDEVLECALVVPAMGIRPRDQIAREAGLRCDLFGGIEVDDFLLTSDPHISAVGECARHRGMAYGLVAPGYAMAESVARRLAGASQKFTGVQVGTRLKVSGVDLTVVGESYARGLGLREHIFQESGVYRRLAVRRGRVIGITAVGPWEDLPRAQEAMARAEKLKSRQLKRFSENQSMWKSSNLSLHTWPDSATVCTCMGVTCGALRRAQREGCANVEALAQMTGASTVCGSCRPLLATLTDQPIQPNPPSRWMTALSVASVLGAFLFLSVPAIPYATSVQAKSLDVLWRSAELKQTTGFSVAGLFALSILFSMRKRLRWFTWGEFESWRITHAAVGVLGLVGGFLHTGFRLGSNLDFALILVFLGSTLLGGVAGFWDLLEAQLTPQCARTIRAWLIRSHIYLLWPLPVLLTAHIIKVYFF